MVGMLRFIIYGKERRIYPKYIYEHTSEYFEARYKQHTIVLQKNEENEWDMYVWWRGGGAVVDGSYDPSFRNALKRCLENILLEEKEKTS